MLIQKSPIDERVRHLTNLFENFLLVQRHTWYNFFIGVFNVEGAYKSLNLIVNDKVGLLNISKPTRKCQNEEYISVFRSFKNYLSGELV